MKNIKLLLLFFAVCISFVAHAQWTLTANPNDPTWGNVAVNPVSTTYPDLSQVTVNASANTGYHFKGWLDNTLAIYISTDPIYTFNIGSNTDLTAVFAVGGPDEFEDVTMTSTTPYTPYYISTNSEVKDVNLPMRHQGVCVFGPANASDIDIVNNFSPGIWPPFSRSTLQVHALQVTSIDDGKAAVTSLINQPGIGVNMGSLSDASYPQSNVLYNFGVHGEHLMNSTLTNPGGVIQTFTSGGYFRNYIGNSTPRYDITLPGNFSAFNSGMMGAVEDLNGKGSPSTERWSAGVLGFDNTTEGDDINFNATPPSAPVYDVNAPGVYNHLNYAGAFIGRGYFSNRVGIGLASVISPPATSSIVISNPAAATHMLHIDGSGLDGANHINKGRVLRLVGLVTGGTKMLTINFDPDAGDDYGGVHFSDVPVQIPMCLDNDFNINHVKPTNDGLDCGRIWDNGDGRVATLGQIGINTPNSAPFSSTPSLNATGDIRIRTAGTVEMNGLSTMASPPATVELLAINTNATSPDEVVRIPYPKFAIPGICDNQYNVNHGNGTGTNALVCGRIWDNGTPATTGQIGINFASQALINNTVNYSGGTQNNTGIPIVSNGRFTAMNITNSANPTTFIVGMNSQNEMIRIPYPTTESSTCAWQLRGNSNVVAPPRALIVIPTTNPACQTSNQNFIGTSSSVVEDGTGTADLVFATQNKGWMRLTTKGALFLTDNPDGTANNGNIKIGRYAGETTVPGGNSVFIGQDVARNATGFAAQGLGTSILIGNRAGINGSVGNCIIIGVNSGGANNGDHNTFIGNNSATGTSTGAGNTYLGNSAGIVATGNDNVYVGDYSGSATNNTGTSNTFVGSRSGLKSTSGENVYIGQTAASNATSATKNVFIGNRAGDGTYSTANNTGTENVCIGYETASGISTGSQNTYLGAYTAARNLTGNLNTCIGYSAAGGIGPGSGIGDNNTYIGAKINISGSNNVCVGSISGFIYGGVNNLSNCVSIGNVNQISGDYAVSIGSANTSTSSQDHTSAAAYAVAIGSSAKSSANSVAIGKSAGTGGGGNSIAIGTFSNASDGGINIGMYTAAQGTNYGLAIGNGSHAGSTGSMAIGYNASANSNNSTAIGPNAVVGTGSYSENCIVIGAPATQALTTYYQNPRVGICTAGPSTRFHVYCKNSVPVEISNPMGAKSAIRFEELQVLPSPCPGGLRNLVIDNSGYVYAGDFATCNPNAPFVPRTANPSLDDTKTDSLLKLIQDLQTKITTMERDMDKCCTKSLEQTIPIKDIKLYQNVPNPFNQTTEIRFFIPEQVKKASLVIYDLNGRELRKMDINDRNDSSIKIYGKELAAGMYIYTLIADDNEVDSKRMILTGN